MVCNWFENFVKNSLVLLSVMCVYMMFFFLINFSYFSSLGDVIAPGDLLCDIQTDKAVVSMDVEEEGILAKILVSPCLDIKRT